MKSAPIYISVVALATVVVVAALAGAPKEEKAPTGKEIFLSYKCNSCHSVKAMSIAKKADEEEEEEESENDRKPPDLSDIGKKAKADYIAKYLMKQVEHDGEKHRKKFKGDEAELKVLAAWIETLKGDAKAAEKKGGDKKDSK